MKKTTIDENEDFVVEITDDEEAIVVSSSKELTSQMLKNALSSYAGNSRTYSADLKERSFMKTTLTEDTIERLAFNAQNDIAKIQEVNSYIDFYMNKDDIIGRVYEIIEANVNADYQLSYPTIKGRNKITMLNRVKTVIKEFNKQIEIEDLIIEAIPYAFANGNRIDYLRKTEYGTYQVDKYPLGVAQLSSFKVNNEPLVLFSLPDLLGRMSDNNIILPSGTGSLNVFDLSLFPDMSDEIKSSYPKEVYDAYKEGKSTVVKLNTDLTSVIRVNNRGKKYGLSPVFKSLNPALKLEIKEKSDSSDSKARAKKIIFQKLSSKLLGEDGTVQDLEPVAFSTQELVKAWKNEVVLYTGAPWVEEVVYVEPKNNTDHFNTLNYYRSKVLSALGIAFLNGDSKTGMITAQISLAELMKVIDKISKQLEKNINKWYKYILNEMGLPIEYAPTIKVLDSELLEMELRLSIADNLFSKYGMSYESVYEMLGRDYNTELEKREKENKASVDEVFKPRLTAFTFNGDESDGTDKKDLQNPTTKEQVNREVKNNEE